MNRREMQNPMTAEQPQKAGSMVVELLTSMPCTNFLYMIFWIPAILWTTANVVSLMTLAQNGAESGQVIRTVNLFLLVLWPCIAITGPANAGICLIIREWLKNESCKTISTFFHGFRENWKHSLVIATITGALPLAFWNCYLCVAQLSTKAAEAVYVFLLIQMLLWLLATQIMYPLMVRFELPLRGLIRNGILLTLMKFPSVLITFVLAWIVPIATWLLSRYVPEWRYAALLVPVLYYTIAGGCIAQYIFSRHCKQLSERYLMGK